MCVTHRDGRGGYCEAVLYRGDGGCDGGLLHCVWSLCVVTVCGVSVRRINPRGYLQAAWGVGVLIPAAVTRVTRVTRLWVRGWC